MAVCSSRTLTSWFVPAAKKCVGHEFPFTAHGASSSILSLDLLMLYSPLWSHKIILLIKKLTLEQTEIRQSSSLWDVLLYVFHSPEATEQKDMRKGMVLSGWQHLEGLESWLFFFFFFWPCHLCGMQELPQPRVKPVLLNGSKVLIIGLPGKSESCCFKLWWHSDQCLFYIPCN